MKLSIIMGTMGFGTLNAAISSITPQLQSGDQLLVLADQTGAWGNNAKNRGIEDATGDYIMFADDDDTMPRGALDAVRKALAVDPGRVHLFRLRKSFFLPADAANAILPVDREVRVGNISTQMFVVPNVPEKLGRYTDRHEGDFDFLQETLAHYPEGPVWHDDVICEWRGTTKLDKIVQAADAIPGFMTIEELTWLANAAASLSGEATWLEIGAWRGRSTVAVGLALPRQCTLHIVDTWSDEYHFKDTLRLARDDFMVTLDKLRAMRSDLTINVWEMDSTRILEKISPHSCDVVFIDGNHSREAVIRDGLAAAELLKPGGLRCGHDYGNPDHPGVREAVSILCSKVGTAGTIWHEEPCSVAPAIPYHTREGWQRRQAERAVNPRLPNPLAVFWHVCAINHWLDVVREQLAVLAHVGLREVSVGFLGDTQQKSTFLQEAEKVGVNINIVHHSGDIGLWEGPTIDAVWDYSRVNLQAAVLYMHSKGVTVPGDRQKKQWRRAMQFYTVGWWKRSLELLITHDFSGLCWQELPDFPHFCGNFWMARCDWIAHLQRPSEYRKRHPGMSWASHSWENRMYCETWLGSEQWHTVDAYTRNGCLWHGPQVFGLPTQIDGFTYED